MKMLAVGRRVLMDMACSSSGHRMKLRSVGVAGVMSGHWGVGGNDHVASSER